jgi:polysaccharide biosynthesis/export protein
LLQRSESPGFLPEEQSHDPGLDRDGPGNTMRLVCHSILPILLIPSFCACGAQQTSGRPVLSAEPSYASPAPVPTAGPGSVSANYIIGPDDSIQVTVWKEPNYSVAAAPVRPDGKITIPQVGDIPAAGFTPMQLASSIAVRLKEFVVDPVVDVSVLGVNSKRAFLIGEISHVGPLQITPGMTILQAIATAGGLTPYANKKHIYILRGDPANQQKIPFDYSKALKKGDMQGVSLMPGDTIVVP